MKKVARKPTIKGLARQAKRLVALMTLVLGQLNVLAEANDLILSPSAAKAKRKSSSRKAMKREIARTNVLNALRTTPMMIMDISKAARHGVEFTRRALAELVASKLVVSEMKISPSSGRKVLTWRRAAGADPALAARAKEIHEEKERVLTSTIVSVLRDDGRRETETNAIVRAVVGRRRITTGDIVAVNAVLNRGAQIGMFTSRVPRSGDRNRRMWRFSKLWSPGIGTRKTARSTTPGR